MTEDDNEEEFDDTCDIGQDPWPTADDDVDGVVLFADVDPSDGEAIEKRQEEWRQLFNAE